MALKPRAVILHSSTDGWQHGICQAQISTAEAQSWRRRRDPKAHLGCNNLAKYQLDGKRYCGRHAGSIALSILLGEQ